MKTEKEMRWKNAEGELTFDKESRIWYFSGNSKEIWITAWKDTRRKGPITEIVLKGEEKTVILEILEKKFQEKFYSPKKANKENDRTAAELLVVYCRDLSRIDMSCADYSMRSELYQCAQRLAQQLAEVKEIHVYYGNGLFFGLKKKGFDQVKELLDVPCRSLEFPGTRLDSIVD